MSRPLQTTKSISFINNLFLSFIFLLLLPLALTAQSGQQLSVTATNNLAIGRLNQMIELSASQLRPVGSVSFNTLHVKDAAGRELVCQAIDTNGDQQPDKIIFQADFAPNQTRTFVVYSGESQLYQAKEFKTYGRFVKERFDDFAWENDRIGQRVYGQALMTTKFGPLTSSAIDIWPKKTSELVINNWYMTDHYHIDMGDGADLYVSGKSRGVGGDGIWSNNQLWVSENYSDSRVITTGPIRVSFDLNYNKFEVNGNNIKEEKNITLDAGHNLNHFTIRYQPEQTAKLQAAAGIQTSTLSVEEIRKGLNQCNNRVSIERKPGPVIEKETNPALGWTVIRQAVSVGELYTAIIVNPRDFVSARQDKDNFLVLTNLPDNNTFTYWAGYCWTESGQFKSFDEWKTYIDNFARSLLSPIQVSIK